MKVKELIRELKKLPQNMEVGVAAHDNQEWEIAGWAWSVLHFVKEDCNGPNHADRMWDDAPEECVIIRC